MDQGQVGVAVQVARVKVERLAEVLEREQLVVLLLGVKPG